MVEGEKHLELVGRNGNLEAIEVDAMRVLYQTIAFDGFINGPCLGIVNVGTEAMYLYGKVAKLDVIMMSRIHLLAPVVATRQGTQQFTGFMEVVEAHKEVDVAKLPKTRIGIEQGQAESLENHRFDAMLTQQLHRRHQNLL